MIEMPEATTIAGQMQQTLTGKTVARFARGPLTHKFLWLSRPDEEYQSLLPGLTVTGADSFGRSIYLRLGKYMLWWGDTGGKILHHAPGAVLPKKYHLLWEFADGSSLTFAMEMWGYVKLLDRSQFKERPKDESGAQPLSPEFTVEALSRMMDAYPEKTAKGVKGLLVATGHLLKDHINGLGNAYVQDILFRAGIDPRRKVMDIDAEERRNLFDAIQSTIALATELGGREDESDLFNQPGRYVRLMDSRTAGQPCPNCRKPIQKITYLGGACYLCPKCQS
jgi:formamidopyrimidine-DNA glycosylase